MKRKWPVFVGMGTAMAIWSSTAIAEENVQPSPKAASVAPSEAWRTNLAAFAEEVVAVASKSEMTDAEVAITRIRSKAVFTGAAGENRWAVFPDGFDNELQGKLAEHFQGKVTWKGIVDAVETDAEAKKHVIELKFPLPTKMPQTFKFRSGIRMEVPFDRLPSARLPVKGSEFSFRGALTIKQKECPYQSVWVYYGLGPNRGTVLVGVIPDDVEPLIEK